MNDHLLLIQGPANTNSTPNVCTTVNKRDIRRAGMSVHVGTLEALLINHGFVSSLLDAGQTLPQCEILLRVWCCLCLCVCIWSRDSAGSATNRHGRAHMAKQGLGECIPHACSQTIQSMWTPSIGA